MKIDVTLWRTFSRGRRHQYTIREFIDTFIASPEVASNKKKIAGYSLGRFTENRRSKPRTEHVHALILDFDEGDTTIEQALSFFPGAWRIAYTSFRHTPEHPKLRLILPFTRPVNADEYERIWIWATRLLPPGHVPDEGARDASRFWYLPSHPPGAAYEWQEGTGAATDPGIGLEAVGTQHRPLPGPRALKTDPRAASAPGRGRVRAQGDEAADASFFGRACVIAGAAFPLISNGALPIVCPWVAQHTCGYDGDTSTVIFPPTTESRWGLFKCSHAHCARRVTNDLLDVLPVVALEQAGAEHGRGLVRVRIIDGWRQRLEALPDVPALERFILKCRPREKSPFSMTVKERSSLHSKYLDELPLQLLLGRRIDVSLEGRSVKAARLVQVDMNMPSAEKRARGVKILAAHEPGQSVDGASHDFLFSLLMQHPRLEEKIGPGLRRIRVSSSGPKRLEVLRIDGTSVDFGLKV